MRFMVIYPATKDSEREGALPDPQLMAPLPKALASTSQARAATSPTVPSPKPRNSSLAS